MRLYGHSLEADPRSVKLHFQPERAELEARKDSL
jgi:hypothetical protein